MTTDIILTDITNGTLDINNDWTGTGIFDVLMSAVNKNIESQYMKNRITGSDYATVYLGSIQAVLQQSMEYALREKLVEAQIDNAIKDTEFKTEQVKLLYTERVGKDKEVASMGLDNVVKLRETSRVTDATYVYQPAYEGV